MIGVILDLTIIALLAAAGVYAARLNARLGAMRRAQDDMLAAIAAFDDAAIRAGRAVAAMNSHSDQRRAAKNDAARLIADLGVMVASGERAAARLEAAIAEARAGAPRAA
jgi:hypothetical protein